MNEDISPLDCSVHTSPFCESIDESFCRADISVTTSLGAEKRGAEKRGAEQRV